MSLPPEYVPDFQDALASLRKAERIIEAALRDIGSPANECCGMCGGRGVVHEGSIDSSGALPTSRPCSCVKGAPFRAAAAVQRAKSGREAAAGRDE